MFIITGIISFLDNTYYIKEYMSSVESLTKLSNDHVLWYLTIRVVDFKFIASGYSEHGGIMEKVSADSRASVLKLIYKYIDS